VLMLAPLAPHVSAELWLRRHPGEPTVHLQPWPVADAELARVERTTMVVQVNGRVRARLEVDPELDPDDAAALALAEESVIAALGGREVARVVSRPPRLVNLIV
ncbi:MAG TPA: class I tRNA ligase family protein, partial [Acidimicrobiales bacterium]|nr:class I tRNA ligase family protein [Acidimicrobiales bacterium]